MHTYIHLENFTQVQMHIILIILLYGASLVAQLVKNPPAMPETWVWSLGREDPLQKEMAIRSNILAWEIPWTEEPDGIESMGSQTSDST